MQRNVVRLSLILTFLVAVHLIIAGRTGVLAQDGPQTLDLRMTTEELAAYEEAADRNLDYLPNQVIVKFKSGTDEPGQQRALMALRSRPGVNELKWIGDAALVTDRSEPNARILAERLREQPEVEYAEPNYLRRLTAAPNDPSFTSRQWNLQVLDLARTWDITPGGKDTVIVAVVDSGITTVSSSFTFRTWSGFGFITPSIAYSVNPDLKASRLVSPRDFVLTGGSTVLDMEGHGTHVSGTIGEDTNNAIAEAGIAYSVKIMPVKVCASYWDDQFTRSALGISGFSPLNAGGCSTANVVQGIRYAADNGAKVINLSLGGISPSIAERDAITYAVDKGAFVAIAAGNDFEDGNPAQYPAGFAKDIDGAISVAAVGPTLKHSFYSSAGSFVEIAAPGGDSHSGGDSAKIWQAAPYEDDHDIFTVIVPRFDRFVETPSEGTSMAAPHVAGVAALIISRGVTNPAAVEALIKRTARDLGPAGRDDLYGYGLIQPRTALLGFGFGK
jgi:serine protease